MSEEESGEAPTVALPVPRQRDGCRSKLPDGSRCRHPRSAHRHVGHSGWRLRCACGCKQFRDAWSVVLTDIGIGAGLFLFGLVVFLLLVGEVFR